MWSLTANDEPSSSRSDACFRLPLAPPRVTAWLSVRPGIPLSVLEESEPEFANWTVWVLSPVPFIFLR